MKRELTPTDESRHAAFPHQAEAPGAPRIEESERCALLRPKPQTGERPPFPLDGRTRPRRRRRISRP